MQVINKGNPSLYQTVGIHNKQIGKKEETNPDRGDTHKDSSSFSS